MGAKAVIIIFMVVILGIGLYLFQSGLVGQAVSGLSFLAKNSHGTSSAPISLYNPPLSLFGGSKLQSAPPPPAPLQTFHPSPSPTSPSPTAVRYPTSSPISPSEIPKGYTLQDLSPYFHKVKIGSVTPGSVYSSGQISLYSSSYGQSTSSIDVSGWVLQARQGSQIVPQAIDVFDPSGLTAETDIWLRGGDMVYIYTTKSVIGKNLRLNKCIGYIQNINHFVPALPTNCPYPDRSQISGFSGQCQNYILSLGSCRLPDINNAKIPANDYACQAYLNDNFNYKACFDTHQPDTDFLSHQIYTWSGARFLDQYHDTIVLFDRNHLVVDTYSY